jgi:murein DD-endopeptidase MepM/ murein hydrolase activator NlpD
VAFGNTGNLPIAGDWVTNYADGIGLYNPANGSVQLKNETGYSSGANIEYMFGAGGDRPVAGRWAYANSCSFLNTSGMNKRLFKAPIDGNPPVLKSNGSGFQEILSSAFSKLNVTCYADAPSSGTGTTRWLYVENQENNPITPGWIKASEVTGTTPACDNALLVNDTLKYYPLPDIPWTINLSSTASPLTFRSWPVSAETMCSRPSNPKGFYALNRAEDPSLYPRGVHPGVDFFTPDVSNILINSMSEGIVVGIAIGKPETLINEQFNNSANRYSQRIWGGTVINDGINNIGYAVIIRSGYLYLLYGHLRTLDDKIWVGARVTMGQQLGILGKYGERHLHLEVHSFGPSTAGFYSSLIRYSGILPVIEGLQGARDVPPYLYDAVQISPSIPQLSGPTLFTQIATNNLITTPGGINQKSLSFSSFNNCVLEYETVIGQNKLYTLQDYRTTHEYNALPIGSLYSINLATTPPPP